MVFIGEEDDQGNKKNVKNTKSFQVSKKHKGQNMTEQDGSMGYTIT